MKCTSATFRKRGPRAQGFAAIAAVFILIVLGVLGATLVTIFSGQQRSVAFDALGGRAYQAARAGIEFGLFQALGSNTCNANPSFALTGNLSGFSVQVTCTSTSHTEVAAPAITIYQITATACNRTTCPGTADATYVERQLRVVASSSAP